MAYTDSWIVESLRRRMAENLQLTNEWRMNELMENYMMFSDLQYTVEMARTLQADGVDPQTINRLSPVINSIAGFEVQNRFDVKYLPRLGNQMQEGYSDVLNDTVKYIEENANSDIQISYAFKDMLICGLGAVDSYLSYDNNPDGEIVVERVFPGFVFYDITARAKNLTDAGYVIRIKIVPKDTFKEDFGLEYGKDVFPSDLDPNVIQYFNNTLMSKDLATIYEYQWRDKEKFYRVKNPFLNIQWQSLDQVTTEFFLGLAAGLSEEYEFDALTDPVFSIFSRSKLSQLKKIFKEIGHELEYTHQTRFKYYRALVTGDRVLEKSENFSQTGFSIKFMSGEYNELKQYYYGLVTAAKVPQRMLNQAVTDFMTYLSTIPKGGVEIEADAVNNLSDFVQTYTKARYVTVYESGALSEGKVRPKVAQPMPQGIIEMIQYTDNQIMQLCGVTPEFMGAMTSKELTATLQRQLVKQVMTTLAPYFDAKRTFLQQQGKLYIDCVRILAENAEGRLIRNITGSQNAQYFPLLLSDIAAEYDVVVDQVPETNSERMEMFRNLLEFQQVVAPYGINLMPIIIEKAPVDMDTKNQMKELIAPPPPQEPDPLNTALLETEVRRRAAEANLKEMDAIKRSIEVDNLTTEQDLYNKKLATDIVYNEAKTIKTIQ